MVGSWVAEGGRRGLFYAKAWIARNQICHLCTLCRRMFHTLNLWQALWGSSCSSLGGPMRLPHGGIIPIIWAIWFQHSSRAKPGPKSAAPCFLLGREGRLCPPVALYRSGCLLPTWPRRPALPATCSVCRRRAVPAGSPLLPGRSGLPFPCLCRCRLYLAGAASPSATSSHSSSSPPSPSPLSSSESLRLALRSCVMSLRTCKGEGGALIRANAHQVQLVTGRPIRLFQSGVFISCVCGVLLRCPRPRCPLAHLHVLACHVVGCLPIL